jgi:hypothetical protein
MADVDTPTCRAISMVIPQSSTNLRETSALTAGISPGRLPLRNSVRGNFTFLHSSAIKRLTFLPGQQLQNCSVRPCNHTFVADSFEKRDDFCIARKLADEFFHLIRLCQNPVHTSRTSARTGLGVTEMKCLTVRPEPSRRAPIKFSHSLLWA